MPSLIPDSRLVCVSVALPTLPDSAMVQRAIDSMHVGDPIKSAFHPRLRYAPETQLLMCDIWTLDSNGGGRLTITFTKGPLPLLDDEPAVMQFIREFLIEILTHELDECLFSYGRHVNYPHTERRQSECLRP